MIVAIIQARMGSTRLPGKVLLPLGTTTVLGHTVGRVQQAKQIGRVVVATSTEADDGAIERHCKELGVECMRGSLNDVLDRYYSAAKVVGAEHVARITSDCPLVDPKIIDATAARYFAEGCDYISTGRAVSTFPDGMDTEIFSFGALERAWREATLPSEREHVTPYIWNHPELFRVVEYKNDRDLSGVRVTLDEAADYEVIKDVVAHAGDLSCGGVVAYLGAHPEVAEKNGSIMRNSGYQKSLKEDEAQKH